MDSNEEFSLDEVAASNHNPPGWARRDIEITHRGKAPKHYGPRAYRFSAPMTLSVILPKRGWTLLKQTKNYAYLIPPTGANPPFTITISVPTEAECINLARRAYQRGFSWQAQLGEWPALYLHERRLETTEMWRNQTTGDMDSRLHVSPPESRLHIGEWGVWEAVVTGVGGTFKAGYRFQQPASPHPQAQPPAPPPLPDDPALFEGAVRTVELTQYERNAAARRLCLAHFGPTCQVCGLNYERKYGHIGADLIHVHHLTPLAAIGDSYQVDPLRDLIPLCATCHHVAHARVPPYTPEEIRASIRSVSAPQH